MILLRTNQLAMILLFGLSLAFVGVISGEEKVNSELEEDVAAPVEPRLRLFDFEHFEKVFNKRYLSMSERLNRARIFMVSAYKVFIDWILFRNRQATSYSGINEMSDWTSEEVDRLYVYGQEEAGFDSAEHFQEAMELSDVERSLGEIVRRKHTSHAYASAAREIEQPDRSALDSLVPDGAGSAGEPSARLLVSVPSNNPDYQAPVLLSMGDEEQPVVEPPLRVNSFRVPEINFGRLIHNGIQGVLTSGGQALESLVTSLAGKADDDPLAKQELADQVFVDHRTSGCLAQVRNQGRCGSCYIFSTIAMFEYEHCKLTGKLVEFAEQYPLDCGDRRALKGCRGGLERDVIGFTREFGLELRAKYPYSMEKEECPYSPDTEPKNMGYLKLGDLYVHKVSHMMLDLVVRATPVLIGVLVSDQFKAYKGGVHEAGSSCNKSRGHAMLLIGHGRQNGMDYWLFRNSHGPHWGEAGYYKLDKKSGRKCLMGNAGLTLTQGLLGLSIGAATVTNQDYDSRPVELHQAKKSYSPPTKYPPRAQ